MAEPIEIIITQGGGGNYFSPTLNNVYNQGQSNGVPSGTGVGRGQSTGGFGLTGGQNPIDRSFGSAATAIQAAAIIQVAQMGMTYASQVIKNKASLQSQISGDYVAFNNTQQYVDLATRAINVPLNIAKKTLAGAGVGAILGSIVPGIGNIAGAGIGAVAGAAFGVAGEVNRIETQIKSRLNELKIDYITTEQMSIRAGMPFGSNSRNTRY